MATPLTAKQLRLMAVDAQILPMVCGGDSLPMDLGRAVRFFTPAQRLALIERDGGWGVSDVLCKGWSPSEGD